MVDIHPPTGPVHSLKDFFYHLLTVVIGILIALSLEGLVEWHHHRSLAEQSRNNLKAEIRKNCDVLLKGLASAPDAEHRLTTTVDEIEAMRKTHAAISGFDWSFGIFVLYNTAWRTAESTGALSYLDFSEVQGLTRVYALQDQFNSVQQRSLDQWLALQKWSLRADPKKGFSDLSSDDFAKIEEAASTALVYTQEEESVAKTLVEEYKHALANVE
jgi:hypothetical protein